MSHSVFFDKDVSRVPVFAWVDGVPFEDAAKEQTMQLSRLPFIFKHVAIMPDVRAGYGSTVGCVIATKDVVLPAAVGGGVGGFQDDGRQTRSVAQSSAHGEEAEGVVSSNPTPDPETATQQTAEFLIRDLRQGVSECTLCDGTGEHVVHGPGEDDGTADMIGEPCINGCGWKRLAADALERAEKRVREAERKGDDLCQVLGTLMMEVHRDTEYAEADGIIGGAINKARATQANLLKERAKVERVRQIEKIMRHDADRLCNPPSGSENANKGHILEDWADELEAAIADPEPPTSAEQTGESRDEGVGE